MKREPKTENDVKELVLAWFKGLSAWHYAPVQTAMGIHGVHDRLGCLPVVVTPEMVGKTVGLFVSVEAKKPGRRGQKNRGMSVHQKHHMDAINIAGGISICCDGREDLTGLDQRLLSLISEKAAA